MLNKWLIAIIIGGVCMSLNSCHKEYLPEPSEDCTYELNANIIIDGERTEYDGSFIESGTKLHIVMPLISCLDKLGVAIIWEDNDNAVLKSHNKCYRINLDQLTLSPLKDGKENLLNPPPGQQCKTVRYKQEILVDIGLFNYIVRYLDIEINVTIDDEPNSVIIESK